jgi:hypothetical protein
MAADNNLTQPLTILLWNANGILKNINELQITLIEKTIDIAMISETHLTHNNFLNIHGYETLRADHPDGTSHGGTALLISNRIPHSLFPSHSSNKLQIIASSIVLNSIPISFASAYFPPGCLFLDNEFSIFLLSLDHTFIIGADFNAKHLKWGSRYTNPKGRSLLRVISSSHAKTLSPDSPTYWPTHVNRHPAILDFFITNLPNHLKSQITN